MRGAKVYVGPRNKSVNKAAGQIPLETDDRCKTQRGKKEKKTHKGGELKDAKKENTTAGTLCNSNDSASATTTTTGWWLGGGKKGGG